MPGFDGSGPMGGGPMTGGARGYCNPGSAGSGYRFGYGRGMGFGRGFRGNFGAGRGLRRGYGRMYAPGSPDELNDLKQQADSVKITLDAINSRIAELEKTE